MNVHRFEEYDSELIVHFISFLTFYLNIDMERQLKVKTINPDPNQNIPFGQLHRFQSLHVQFERQWQLQLNESNRVTDKSTTRNNKLEHDI